MKFSSFIRANLFVGLAFSFLTTPAQASGPDEWKLGQYKIESTYEPSGGRRLTIVHNDDPVYSEDMGQFWFVAVKPGNPSVSQTEPVANDITGDGVPELIVEEYPVGLPCCWSYKVFSLGAKFKELADVEGFPTPMSFTTVRSRTTYAMVGDDWTFYPWYASPQIVLRPQGGSYRLAASLMKRPAPTEVQLAAKAKTMAKATVYAERPVAPDVYRYMLDLIYSGNAKSAWHFLELAWPVEQAKRQQFIDSMMEQLKKSRFWPELRAMNGL